jgi:hypothetical protein
MAAAAALLRVAMPGSIRQQATSCVAVKPAFQLGQFFLSRVSRVCLRRLPIRVLSCPFQSGNSLGLRIGPPPSALGPGMAGLLEQGSVTVQGCREAEGREIFPGVSPNRIGRGCRRRRRSSRRIGLDRRLVF